MSRAQNVDEYVEGFAGQGRALLQQVRTLAHRTVPEAGEAIKWAHPARVHPSGTVLFMVNGHTKHANVVFTPSTREAFDTDLADFGTGKGSIKLPYDRPALRTEDGEPLNVAAVLASFQVVRYDRVKEPGPGGGSCRLYRRRREPAV